MALYRGDDLPPITIDLVEDEGEIITKAEAIFNGGTIIKPFENPTFPITVKINANECKLLAVGCNVCNLIVYIDGEKITCDGALYFNLEREVSLAS